MDPRGWGGGSCHSLAPSLPDFKVFIISGVIALWLGLSWVCSQLLASPLVALEPWGPYFISSRYILLG